MPVFIGPDKKPYRFNEYDVDFVVPNSKTQKKIDTQFNNEAITNTRGDTKVNNWNRNHYSTRKKVYRDIVVDRDHLMKNSINYHNKKIKPRKWYNW